MCTPFPRITDKRSVNFRNSCAWGILVYSLLSCLPAEAAFRNYFAPKPPQFNSDFKNTYSPKLPSVNSKLKNYFTPKSARTKQLKAYTKHMSPADQKIINNHSSNFTPQQITKMNTKIQTRMEKELPAMSAKGAAPAKIQQKMRDIVTDVTLTRVGKNQVKFALQKTANDTGHAVGIRGINPDAYKHIARGAPTKPMEVKGKSAVGGELGGYIPVKAKFSKAGGTPEVGHYNNLNKEMLAKHSDKFAATTVTRVNTSGERQTLVYKRIKDRNGNVVLNSNGGKIYKQTWKTDQKLAAKPGKYKPIQVIGQKSIDSKGNTTISPITADADLALVGTRRDSISQKYHDTLALRGSKGLATQTDEKVIESYNRNSGTKNPLMHHGPAAFDPANTPLGKSEKIIVAVPGQSGPSTIQGFNRKGSNSKTDDELHKWSQEGSGKDYDFPGTNTSIKAVSRRRISVDPNAQKYLDSVQVETTHKNEILKSSFIDR